MKNDTRLVFFSDIHWPYHNQLAYKLFLKYLGISRPDRVIIGGDGIDNYQVSKYGKDVTKLLTVQSDLDVARNEIINLRNVTPNSTIDYIQGNHELRMKLYLQSKAIELASLRSLSIPSLLELDKVEVNYFEGPKWLKIGDLNIGHGHELNVSGGVGLCQKIFNKFGVNYLGGHFHVFDSHIRRSISDSGPYGYNYVLINAGMLDMDVDYTLYPNWVTGFTEVHFNKSGKFEYWQVQIKETEEEAYFTIHGQRFSERRIVV